MLLYMALLCRRHFNLTSLAFLRKSHTHDRVGTPRAEPCEGLAATVVCLSACHALIPRAPPQINCGAS